MLNISKHPVDKEINHRDFDSFKKVGNRHGYNRFSKILFGVMIFLFLCLFLPWTQNVSLKGKVTSLRPEERPQTIVSNIPGRIDQWYVQEGQLVHKGDTIITLSEIKSDYLDDELIERVDEQLEAKQDAIIAYKAKVDALDNQFKAIEESLKFKRRQAFNKVEQAKLQLQADSLKFKSAEVYYETQRQLYERNKQLYDSPDGHLISLTKLQKVQAQEQLAKAKEMEARNKVESSDRKLINTRIELSSISAQYADKLAKNRSDRSSAASTLADAYASLSKLKNQRSNYIRRDEYKTILAPQDGYITKALKTGLGELVKEGDGLVTIMPKDHHLAVELYVDAVDMPLMSLHHEVNLIFDGWPVIAVSGWPDLAYGTFKGEIVAIDNMISANGKYRILVSPKRKTKEWSHHLRLGSGVKGFALLNDVPVYKEFWRRMNGFPPDFYDEYKHDQFVGDKKKGDKK
ncbi:HlyD family secretion protein [Cyclobacteriaceae bacterium]|nr:HlyD family secretion protein [Cyclobacteriaceae bacterium]